MDLARAPTEQRRTPLRHCPAGPSPATASRAGLAELVEQRFCLFQVGGVEAFGKPAIDRCDEVAGFDGALLVAAEPGEAHSGPQFPELGLLLPGDVEGLAIQFLGGLGVPLS